MGGGHGASARCGWRYGIMAPMSTNPERPRAKNLNPLRALLPFLEPYRAMMGAALGALLVASVAMLALPLALRQLIDHVVAAKDSGTINWLSVWFPGGGGRVRRICGAALLSGDMAGGTRGRRFACGRLPPRRAHGSLVLRDHPGRRSAVAPDHRHHAGAGDRGRQSVHHPAVHLELDRRAGAAGTHQRQTHGRHAGADSRGGRAAHRHRPARARPVARFAGSHRGHQRPRGRDLERDPNRAGVHAGGAAERTLSPRRWKTASRPPSAARRCARR